MWLGHELIQLLGVEQPIIQAPMILQKSLVPLTAAVCESGGLGSLGCAEMSLADVEESVSQLRKLTGKSFNLNFFLHQQPSVDDVVEASTRTLVQPFYQQTNLELPHDTGSTSLNVFDDSMLELLVELRPPVVSFHFGCPATHVVDALKAIGSVTMACATTVAEAKTLNDAGLDVIIAQGWEAGGHRGSFDTHYEEVGIGTMALTPQVVDAVDVPVVAAGGIGDGRGIAAAFALGASGVAMGTAFLSCTEAPISDQHRRIMNSAGDEDTILTRAFSGRPCRTKRNRYIDTMAKKRQPLPAFPLMYNFTGPLKRFGIDNDDPAYQFFLYGQAAALNRDLSVSDLMQTLVSEADAVFTSNQ